MLRNRITLALALSLAFAPFPASAGGYVDICGPVGADVIALLNRYASTDPYNYCVRAMSLAQTNCRPRDVIAIANQIGQPRGLPPVVPGCQPPVLMSAVPVYAPPPVVEAAPRVVAAKSSDDSLLWLGLGLLGAGGIAAALLLKDDCDDCSSTTTTESTEIDDEFNAQYTLSIINAQAAYQRGYTGDGVVIGLIDTGLRVNTSPEFAGRVSPDGGYDFVEGHQGMPSNDLSLNPHGTEVAGIIAANRNYHGMHGVAYNALIQPLRVFDQNGVAINNFVNAINYATTSGTRIINGSYGPDDNWHTASEAAGHQIITNADMLDAQAYLNAVAYGAILVFPAGNSYQDTPAIAANPTGPGFLPFIRPANMNITSASAGAYRDAAGNKISADYSALEPNTIVVVGTDANGTILNYSNRCGVTKNWCMAAPAQNIFTTLNGEYTTVNGTSFAAPQVSGAAAILKQQFPSLTGAQIVDILLSTATDLGAAGVDAVYGHGMLNLAAATAPVGTTGIATKGLVDGARVSLESTALVFSPAFGEDAAATLGAEQIAFLDSYDRAYQTSLGYLVRTNTDGFDAGRALAGYGREDARVTLEVNGRTSLAFVNEGSAGSSRFTSEKPRTANDGGMNIRSFALTSEVADGMTASVHYKDAGVLALGFSEEDRGRNERAIVKGNLANPYAAFAAGQGYASVIRTEALGGTVRVAGFFGHEGGDSQGRAFGTQVEAAHELDKDARTFLAVGTLFENNYVLGSKGSGAFAFGNGTMTVYTGAGGKLKLDGRTTLKGAAYAGWTRPSLSDDSLITGMSSLVTTAFNIGVERKDVAKEGDLFSFTVAQPLRVEGGSMQFNLPYARDASGNEVYTTSLTQDLGASGREIDLEANYMVPVGELASFTTGVVYRHDAGHVAGKKDILGLVRYTKKF